MLSIRVEQLLRERRRWQDGLILALLALGLRVVIVVWASSRFPPADDGAFYHTVATRIAAGHGYTWAWPDGAVTYAAHYPVGYPALIGAAYAVFGAAPLVAMLQNALIGAAAVWAVHDLARSMGSRATAIAAAAVVAFHPGLVLYTPALMTEAVVGSLVAVAAAFACRLGSSDRGRVSAWLGLGMLSGAIVLMRPQTLLFVPLLGVVAAARSLPGRRAPSSARRRGLLGAVLLTGASIACCLPWTLRNCQRMDRCAFVSANGGWNLLIGSQGSSFVAISGPTVPAECREVFAEVAKDACFGRAGLSRIGSDPLHWLAKIPSKLAVTFDYIGASAHYLHASNPKAFEYDDKVLLGTVETIWHRLTLLAVLIALARAEGPSGRKRRVVCLLSAPWLFLRSGFVAHLGLVAAAGMLGPRALRSGPLLLGAGLLALTALTHAIFFGAGRYALVVVPLLSALIAVPAAKVAAKSPLPPQVDPQ